MSKKKQLEKQDQKIRLLYTLIWFLACPLAYVIARLAGFTDIFVVYCTLLVVPLLLGIYNVRQVPSVKKREVPAVMEGAEQAAPPAEAGTEDELTVTHTQRLKLLALSLKAPAVIALPLAVTVIVDLCLK